MSVLERLARYEAPHSGLVLRKTVYGNDELVDFVIDCLALANSEGDGRRVILLGIDSSRSGTERLIGVPRADLKRLKRFIESMLVRFIEPALDLKVRGFDIDGRLIGCISLGDRPYRPYLAKRSFGRTLRAGQGFIRRGTSHEPLTRAELRELFSRSRDPGPPGVDLIIGFAGQPPSKRLSLPPLGIGELPSQLARKRLEVLLAAKSQSRDVLGRTETHLTRLAHARVFGMDVPFEHQGDDTLRSALERVDTDYRAADEYYLFENRAHKINLAIDNRSDSILSNVTLSLSMPHVPGTGVAERVYREDGTTTADGYPSVVDRRRRRVIENAVGTLFAGRSTSAFREPLRFCARAAAAGRSIPVDYSLTADELDAPLEGRLFIDIDDRAVR